jgi:acetyl-CoA carboxylase biotin carboxyl carrier protein
MPSPKDPVSKPTESVAAERIDTELVRELAAILNDTELTEIEVERGDLRIRVARGVQGAALAASAAAFPTHFVQNGAAPAAPAEAAAPVPALARGDLVKSPMVGTVYLSPQPGADPFVKPGDRVAEGQTVLIVEAMKTMNPIPSPRAGTVVELLVSDGQPVEYGEGLLVLE